MASGAQIPDKNAKVNPSQVRAVKSSPEAEGAGRHCSLSFFICAQQPQLLPDSTFLSPVHHLIMPVAHV